MSNVPVESITANSGQTSTTNPRRTPTAADALLTSAAPDEPAEGLATVSGRGARSRRGQPSAPDPLKPAEFDPFLGFQFEVPE